MLVVVENTEEQISWRKLSDMEFTIHQIKQYFEYAVRNGAFNGMDFEKMLDELKEPRFSDLISILGLKYGSGVWKENAEFLYDEGIQLRELISCREDVYFYLYSKMKGKCCENPVGQVFEIKECVRKGKYLNKRMLAEVERLLLDCDVPEWYIESMKKILYLFPKTHIIVMLKRDICKYATSEMI